MERIIAFCRKLVINHREQLKYLFFVVPVLSFLYFISRGINLPYVGPNAWNFNTYSLIAKNYNNFGYINTKLGPIVSISSSIPLNPDYYLHHPPLLSFIQSLFFKLLGDDFWVGRIVVILFSFGSMLLTYLIAKHLWGEKAAFISMFIFSVIPASIVFGRMIGQEPLVLFFSLLCLYFVLKYIKTSKTLYLLLILLAVILGVLSDWPMVYFTFSLIPYLYASKNLKLGTGIFFTSIFVAILFLFYIYFTMYGFSDLKTAFLARSIGEVFTLTYWPLRWIAVIVLRLFVYFGPIIILLSFLYLCKLFKYKNILKEDILLLGLFLFGILHIVLYPEGSYGHPYWIYYLLPFITFSSTKMIKNMNNKVLIVFFLLLSFLFLVKVNDWKIKEVESNLWRYELAAKANEYLFSYENVLINPDSAMDADILKYKFLHDSNVFSLEKLPFIKVNYQHYVYSCYPQCNSNFLQEVLKQYRYVEINSKEAQMFIILLNEKKNVEYKKETLDKNEFIHVTSMPYKENVIKYIYRNIKDILNVPQI